MYSKLIFSFVLALFLSGCGNNATGPIELNNGEKWKVNAEMMPPLNTSQKLISEFSTSDKKDYKTLSVQLKENNASLISSCTMDGKSHDELHKWLLPYIGLLDELESAENEKEADQIFVKIEQSFKTFNQNFQ